MAKEGYLSARMDKNLMEEVHSIFTQVGISKTAALTLFYTQVKISGGLPFAVRIPNAETRQTFEETDSGKNLNSADSVQDLFRQLET